MAFSSRGARQPARPRNCRGEREPGCWAVWGEDGALARVAGARNRGDAFGDLTQKCNGSTRRLRDCVPVNVPGAASIHHFLAQHS